MTTAPGKRSTARFATPGADGGESTRAGDHPSVGLLGLKRLGLQAQAVKSALAAGLAWYVGGFVPWGPAQPYLAPLTAILTVQATIAESVQGALQRVLGVAVGVGMAALAGHTIGISPLTIVLLVVVSQAVGSLLRLTIVGTSQVVISALLVLTVGQVTESGWLYGWGRVAETMVGAAVGIAVNGLVVPPAYARDARRAWQSLAARLLEQVTGLAGDLTSGLTSDRALAALAQARATGQQLDAARASLDQAERALRFNCFSQAQREEIGRYGRAVETLEHVSIQFRGIARVLADQIDQAGGDPGWLRPEALGLLLGRLIGAAADVLGAYNRTIASEEWDTGALDSQYGIARDARAMLLDVAQARMPTMAPNDLIALGAILADLDRMVGDLTSRRDADDARVAAGIGAAGDSR